LSEAESAKNGSNHANFSKRCPIWSIFVNGTGHSVKWKQHKDNPRFAIYRAGTPEDETDDLVLDRETCLVWERSPDAPRINWYSAYDHCYPKVVSDRMGWRLPTIEELASLVDPNGGSPTLPAGHPFLDVEPSAYWSATTHAETTINAWYVRFDSNLVYHRNKSTYSAYVWCVRGGNGYATGDW
jgi:hypothetical protein